MGWFLQQQHRAQCLVTLNIPLRYAGASLNLIVTSVYLQPESALLRGWCGEQDLPGLGTVRRELCSWLSRALSSDTKITSAGKQAASLLFLVLPSF